MKHFKEIAKNLDFENLWKEIIRIVFLISQVVFALNC